MGIEVKLPDLGEGIESGDILEVLVAEGDFVSKDQNIVEIETEKATAEVPTDVAGKVAKIHVASGDTVTPGQTLMTIEVTESADLPRAPTSSPPATKAEPAAPSTPMPAAPEPTTPVPTPTASAPPPAPQPTLQPVQTAAQPPPVATATSDATATRPIPAGPAIRRFAREVGVDLASVVGSGTGGRITREDVLEVVRSASRGGTPASGELSATNSAAPSPPADEFEVPGTPATDPWGPVSLEKTTKIRKTIATKMSESWSTVPRVTNFDDADVTELERMRQASKADYAAKGVKLTSLPFIIKSVSLALRENPLINAALDTENGQIIYKKYVNVGVAVDTDRGLTVPVMRNTDQLSISEIAKDLAGVAERVRANNFSLDDLRGGTFTISNLGAIGGTYSTPIVNVPEVAILLVGRSRKMPVVVNDEVAIRLMMPLSLSYDHRLIDGATAARFLNDVIDMLESPGRLLMAP